jgi:hypothetical protein
MKGIAIAAVLIACGCFLPAAGRAQPAPAAAATAAPTAPGGEFTGYGKAPFGMRWEAAKKLFPKAEELPDGKDMGAANIGGPFIHRLYLTDQKVEGLPKPVNVELRFWKKKLWGVIIYFKDDDPKLVLAMLTKRLGASQSTDPDNPLWVFDKTQTSASMKQSWYGINDSGLSKQAQAWFALVMTGQWRAASPAELDEVEDRTPAPATAVPATPAAP